MYFAYIIISAGFDEEVSDRDLAIIARDFLNDWKVLRPFLGLSRSKEKEICQSFLSNNAKQGHECLEVWKEVKGKEATYGALIEAAENALKQNLADGVKAMVKKQPSPPQPHSKGKRGQKKSALSYNTLSIGKPCIGRVGYI